MNNVDQNELVDTIENNIHKDGLQIPFSSVKQETVYVDEIKQKELDIKQELEEEKNSDVHFDNIEPSVDENRSRRRNCF